MTPRGKTCEGRQGLIKEAQEEMEEASVLDAALIASAQKVEHYEIASYGTLATFAKVLDLCDARNLLGQTLNEEKKADESLTRIASQINPEAETEGHKQEEQSTRSRGTRTRRNEQPPGGGASQAGA
jgi:ferritin-like metal-binding protein YciE